MIMGGNAVATAKPDGYTIGMLMVPTAIPEVYRYFQEAPYSSVDLTPICKMHNFVGVVVVKGDAPWNNFKELVEYVRKNPGMKFGIVIKGGAPHLLMIAIEKGTKISFTAVPHPGDADVVMNLIGGHIPIGVVSYPSGKAQIQAGNLKVLATYGEKRFELLPQVPTMVELGCIPAYYPSMGLFAPKGTPDLVVNKISEAVKKCNENPSYRQKIVNIGCEISFESSDQFRNTLNRYKADIGSFLNELGFVKK
jgi:tripartite-type tricarboxylate transporter receptor subunit TctC